MKKMIVCLVASFAILACNQEPKKETTVSANNDIKALYEKNLASLKSALAAFENEKIDDWAGYVADSVKWFPPYYGGVESKKEDWKKLLASYMADWDSLKLVNPNFLPGVDTATSEFDGSVRYYGTWNGVHKSGVHTSVNFYGSYDFNKDGKVTSASDFFDVGGLMNAVSPNK